MLDSFERLLAEIFDHEQARYQSMRCLGDDYSSGFCDRLHTRCDVWRISIHVGTFVRAAADHYIAGIDANPEGEVGTIGELVEF